MSLSLVHLGDHCSYSAIISAINYYSGNSGSACCWYFSKFNCILSNSASCGKRERGGLERERERRASCLTNADTATDTDGDTEPVPGSACPGPQQWRQRVEDNSIWWQITSYAFQTRPPRRKNLSHENNFVNCLAASRRQSLPSRSVPLFPCPLLPFRTPPCLDKLS